MTRHYPISLVALVSRSRAWPLAALAALLVAPSLTAFSAPRPQASADLDNLKAEGGRIYLAQPDPRHRGAFLWKLWVQSFEMKPTTSKQVKVAASGVTAVLFENGKAAARLVAPSLLADSGSQTVTAPGPGPSGRVRIASIVDPGTTIQADRVTWTARSNSIVATGHVVYLDGKTGTIAHTPDLICDTRLKTIRSGPGSVTIPKGF